MKLPLIFFGVMLLVIILAKWYKNRPVKESAPAKESGKADSKKKKTFPFGTIITLVILAAIGYFGYRYFSEYKTQSHPVYTIPAEKWYLSNEQYWKKDGGMDQAQVIRVDITENSLYAVYKILRRERQYGELLAESEDGKFYNGRYQYPGESGDVKLKKLHPTLYEGTATRPNGTTMKIQLLKSPL